MFARCGLTTSRPPELAGREEIVEASEIALKRALLGRNSQSQIFLGLRGTGKTVLLNEVLDQAESSNYLTSFVEAPEDKPLTELLYPSMRQVLRKLSAAEGAKQLAVGGLRALRGFASVFKISAGAVEIGVEPEPGVADSGNLEIDLAEMFEAIGRAAKAAGRGWALLIDEVQYLQEEELAAIIVAVHRMSQRNLPVRVFAGGLPQIAKLSGDAKSYAERLFVFPSVGPLDAIEAANAITKPLAEEEAEIEGEALDTIILRTQGYPFFLQEWGHHAWNAADSSPITVADVEVANEKALARLDDGFFRVRFDRLTKAEVDYVKAMAQLGVGPYKVNDVAKALGMQPKSLGPRRASIIKKGMIYAPSYGEIAFTVPLFEDFLQRTHL
ncbi:ATP-binding protein [Gymnodinialimonas sp.]